MKENISVIVPTYNRAGLLSRALHSIADQSLLPSEIVIVDDGSTDSTQQVVEAFESSSSIQVRYIYQSNSGAPSARNAGIQAARGTYIAFQDSDDSWDPTFLETLLAHISLTGAGVAFSSHRVAFLDGSEEVRPRRLITEVSYGLLKENLISTQTALVRAELLDGHSFDQRLPRLQDWDLWLGLRKSTTFSHVAVPLATLYRQADSLSQNDDDYFIALRIIVRKHFWALFKRPSSFAKHALKCLIGRPIRKPVLKTT